MKTKNPVILIIRDGWGYRRAIKDNLIAAAKTPWDDLYSYDYPHSIIAASGEAVGLPKGYQGNSEVGHMTIGSGRIIFQSLEKINQNIKSGEFFKNPAFLKVIAECRKQKTTLHLIGLIQTQGVHSHINHLFALLDLCRREKFHNVLIHIITDGRDAPVHESLKHLQALNKKIKTLGFGKIVTVSGRYYAMDRNNRYERTAEAYNCLVLGGGETFTSAAAYIKSSHAQKISDEFIKPGKLAGYSGFKTDDGVIFFNFRTDRPRQLTHAILDNNFKEFKRQKVKVNFVAMTEYYKPFPGSIAFPNLPLTNLLGEVLASNNYQQLRISETEKYAHVTFFFNGQKEKPSKGETRILIQSPHVAAYDSVPEMSVFKIAERLCLEIRKKKYDLIVVNLVNGDMVGHTGDRKAVIAGLEAVDTALGEIVSVGLGYGYTSLIFADHGNAEDKSPKFATSHTMNPVPLILVSPNKKLKDVRLKNGFGLQDIAPTALKIMGLKKPKEMTGRAMF
jgi:2,3-bisphosphoglycerate-independent phosphoglycerate mutase